MSNCNEALQRLGDQLQAEADERVEEALKLFRSCSEEIQRQICSSVGMNYHPEDDDYVRNYFDTLDLLDELEFLVDRMRKHLDEEATK